MSVKVMGMVWDLDIPSEEKFVLMAYADHADHNGGSIYPAVKTIADKTGKCERSVQYITKYLEDKGYLIRDGSGDRGTKRWRIPIYGGQIVPETRGENIAPPQILQEGGATSNTEGCNSLPKGVQPSAPEPSLTVIKPSIKNPLSENDLKIANAKVDAILANEGVAQEKISSGKSWTLREHFPEPIRELLDVFVQTTGMKCCKSNMMDWLQTGQEWLELGITKVDVRNAYNVAKDNFNIVRPGSLTNTANACAGERRKANKSIEEKQQERGNAFTIPGFTIPTRVPIPNEEPIG